MSSTSLLPPDPAPVLAWARQYPPDTVIGHTFDIARDPFAAYLKSIGIKNAFIGRLWHWTGSYVWTEQSKCPTPAWAGRIIEAMDSTPVSRPVTAGEFATALERCLAVA